MRKIISLLFCVFAVFALVSCTDGGEPKPQDTRPYPEQFAESKNISLDLANSMDAALSKVTAKYMSVSPYSLSNISKNSFKQVEDWANGRRFYGYLDDQYVIYFYCQGEEVISIRTSDGSFVYQK